MSTATATRIVVCPLQYPLWEVLDSLEPQAAVQYFDREDALDYARGLAAERVLSVVEVIGRNGQVELRERFVRGDDGEIRIERL
jgi:hypothetical protein